MFDLAAAQKATQQPGFKITVGYKLMIPFFLVPFEERKGHYYRHGLSRDTHEWLKATMGPSSSFAEWEFDPDCTARWLYTGSQQIRHGAHQRAQRGMMTNTITIWFRDKRDAMLFKIRWLDHL